MSSTPSKAQAVILVSGSALAVLIVMAGLLIVPRHAILILTIAAGLIGVTALWIMPRLVSLEKRQRLARAEGDGVGDGTALRRVCSECAWHWRAGAGADACPRCGAPARPTPDRATDPNPPRRTG